MYIVSKEFKSKDLIRSSNIVSIKYSDKGLNNYSESTFFVLCVCVCVCVSRCYLWRTR